MTSPADLGLARALPTPVAGVRLWHVALDRVPTDVLVSLRSILSPDECDRATALGDARFRRFAVARATLRLLLADALRRPPEGLRFTYNRDGKPALAEDGATAFSVAHAGEVAVVAVGDARRVGVDVERLDPRPGVDGIVRRFFGDAERAAVGAAPPHLRPRVFTRIWVRKEAYLKGRGEGISQWIHLTDFSVSDSAGQEVPGGVARDQDLWCVRDIDGLPDGYVGAVAVERPSGAP